MEFRAKKMFNKALLVTLSFFLLFIAGTAISFATEDDSGVFLGVPWRITESGELLIGQEGKSFVFEPRNLNDGIMYDPNIFPWIERKDIITAKFLGRVYGNGDMNFMFRGCNHMKSINLSNFDASNVTNMEGFFHECQSLERLDLSSFDTRNVSDMSWMFYDCCKLKELNLSSFNTEQMEDMGGMFCDCHELKKINLKSFNTSRVEDMSWLFRDCRSLEDVDISSFNTGRVTEMSYMFSGCKQLKRCNISSFDMSALDSGWRYSSYDGEEYEYYAEKMGGFFEGCVELKEIALGANTVIEDDQEGDEIIPGEPKWIRYAYLDNKKADGPRINKLSEYDNNYPGWYRVGKDSNVTQASSNEATYNPTSTSSTRIDSESIVKQQGINALNKKYYVEYKGKKRLRLNSEGKITLKVGKKGIVRVTQKGVIVGKKYGKTKITVTEKIGKTVRKKVITVTVVPRKVKISSVKANAWMATIKLKKKDKTVTGYQVYASNRDDFVKNTVSMSVPSRQVRKNCLTVKMPKKTNFYFKVRAYKKLGGKKLYGAWSNAVRAG